MADIKEQMDDMVRLTRRDAGTRRWSVRLLLPALACIAVYAIHWVVVRGAALGLALGGATPSPRCWGKTVPYSHLPHHLCVAAWGGWSFGMYLPEFVMGIGLIVALCLRSARALQGTAVLGAVSLCVSLVLLGVSHSWALYQMPVIWPPLH